MNYSAVLFLDEDDEGEVSAQKSSEESEPSSSEQSSEEHSEHEEEDDEQEDKVESEGEADMADGDNEDEDGNSSLATPEYTFSNCKPVAVYPPSVTPRSESKKAVRVFYGNDMSYILCRYKVSLRPFYSLALTIFFPFISLIRAIAGCTKRYMSAFCRRK